MRECTSCGFIRVENNYHDYAADGLGVDSTGDNPRIGTADTPGREYHLATLAMQGFERESLQILIAGAGVSQDWANLSKLDEVDQVVCMDFHNFSGNPNYLEIGERRAEPFDIAVACEVVEHLDHPLEEIGALVDALVDDGIFIASTNVYDGTKIDKHEYPTIPGHVAYYTPRALRYIAEAAGAYLDFRVPKIATTFAGPRKRYVLMAKQAETLARIGQYFGANEYASAENR